MTLPSYSQFASRIILGAVVWILLTTTAALSDDHDDDLDTLGGRTADQVAALQSNIDEVIETAAFYSAFWALLALLICVAIVQRQFAWAAYATLTLLALTWNALFEQNLGGLYWLGISLSTDGVVAAGLGLFVLNLFVAAILAQGRLRIGIFAIVFLAIPLGWLQDQLIGASATAYFVAICTVSILVHTIPITKLRSFFNRFSQRRLLLATALVVLVWGIFVTAELNEEFDPIFLNRAVVGLLTSAFIVLSSLRSIAVLRDRDDAIRQSLADARKEAATSKALFETEKRYNDARILAKERSRRLATASHDIRQPISALRSTMAAMVGSENVKMRQQMNASFDYLELLAGEYIDEGRLGEEERLPPAGQVSGDDGLTATLLGATIDRMFRADAEAKGLAFSIALDPATFVADPLELMRATSNLTSNAIRHTDAGFVRISGQANDTSYLLSVANSTEFAEPASQMAQAYQKSDTSTGAGLGLAIVQEISDASAFDLAFDTSVPSQTTVRLTIPV